MSRDVGAPLDRRTRVEKRAITAACEKLINEVLLARYVLSIVRTKYNYPVGIAGRWHGSKDRFVTRYRSGMPHNTGEEFDAPFARLEWISKNRFDISFHRHTGQWWPLEHGLTLEDAIGKIAEGGLLAPPI